MLPLTVTTTIFVSFVSVRAAASAASPAAIVVTTSLAFDVPPPAVPAAISAIVVSVPAAVFAWYVAHVSSATVWTLNALSN